MVNISLHAMYKHLYWASLVVQTVENLPTMKETLVQSLGWENPLEKNILQYSCLEKSPDRTAWRATVHEVTESWT